MPPFSRHYPHYFPMQRPVSVTSQSSRKSRPHRVTSYSYSIWSRRHDPESVLTSILRWVLPIYELTEGGRYITTGPCRPVCAPAAPQKRTPYQVIVSNAAFTSEARIGFGRLSYSIAVTLSLSRCRSLSIVDRKTVRSQDTHIWSHFNCHNYQAVKVRPKSLIQIIIIFTQVVDFLKTDWLADDLSIKVGWKDALFA